MSSTNRGAKRNKDDFYATPAASVHSLLDRVGKELSDYGTDWLEPCVGDGAILRSVALYGQWNRPHHFPFHPTWDACDINPLPENCATPGLLSFHLGNYLLFSAERLYNVIITNPPFFLAQEIIEHSLALYDGIYAADYQPVVIMLLRLGFLGSEKRSKWWQGKEPDAVYVLSDRPDFTGGGGDSCDYGWFFFNWHRKGIFVLDKPKEN